MRKLSETDVFDKTIALRVDLNVPVEDGKVLDDTRILAIIPTLKYLLDENAKVRMMANPNTIMEIVISRVRNSINNSFFKSVKNIKDFP